MSDESQGYVESYRQAFEVFPPLEGSRDGDRLHVKRAFRGVTLEQAIGYHSPRRESRRLRRE